MTPTARYLPSDDTMHAVPNKIVHGEGNTFNSTVIGLSCMVWINKQASNTSFTFFSGLILPIKMFSSSVHAASPKTMTSFVFLSSSGVWKATENCNHHVPQHLKAQDQEAPLALHLFTHYKCSVG